MRGTRGESRKDGKFLFRYADILTGEASLLKILMATGWSSSPELTGYPSDLL